MSYAFQTPVGRPVEACPTADIPAIGPDKWQILSALTDAADRFGLSHRPLCVLRALLTFLPERHIPEDHRAIVFPANRTLSDRLGGMPESTLRRHLATLVKAGIVSRHDSPNRKRYAKRIKGGIALAFGIDLAPLVKKARAILNAAQEAQERAERLQVLRARLISLRQELRASDRAGETAALYEDVARALRRKLSEADLRDWLSRLKHALENSINAEEMSASDIQNERHIQGKKRLNSDSEAPDQPAIVSRTEIAEKDRRTGPKQTEISLREVIDRYPGFQCFFPDPVRSWRDLEEIASRLAPMMGIDQPVYIEARQRMGPVATIVTVLYIHDRLAEIKNPGAYLRRLSQTTPRHGFDVMALLHGGKSEKLSADNPETL